MATCPNCGAPLRHLTSGDICEYCGSEFPLSVCQTISDRNFNMYGASIYTPFYACSAPAYINIYADGELAETRSVDPYQNIIKMMQDYDSYGRRR